MRACVHTRTRTHRHRRSGATVEDRLTWSECSYSRRLISSMKLRTAPLRVDMRAFPCRLARQPACCAQRAKHAPTMHAARAQRLRCSNATPRLTPDAPHACVRMMCTRARHAHTRHCERAPTRWSLLAARAWHALAQRVLVGEWQRKHRRAWCQVSCCLLSGRCLWKCTRRAGMMPWAASNSRSIIIDLPVPT